MAEREDFALRAVHEWSATLPGLGVSAEELSTLIRLSRVRGIQERIDDQSLREFEHHGIRGSDDFRTLALLRRSTSGLTNSELLAQLGGSKAGVSTRLERLTKHNITKRVPSETDRRSHTNVLTPDGQQLADNLVTQVVTGRKLLTSSLTTEEIDFLAQVLAKIIDSIDPGG